MRNIKDIEDDLQAANESQGEMEAQFRNEVAMFGDGWAGGQLDLADGNAAIAALNAELVAHPDYRPYVFPGPPAPVDGDDLPF